MCTLKKCSPQPTATSPLPLPLGMVAPAAAAAPPARVHASQRGARHHQEGGAWAHDCGCTLLHGSTIDVVGQLGHCLTCMVVPAPLPPPPHTTVGRRPGGTPRTQSQCTERYEQGCSSTKPCHSSVGHHRCCSLGQALGGGPLPLAPAVNRVVPTFRNVLWPESHPHPTCLIISTWSCHHPT